MPRLFCLYARVSLTRQLQNMEMELETLRGNSSNYIDGNENAGIIQNLRQELDKVKQELARSKEKLGISRISNLNRLVEVAAHREKVRSLEDDLEEVRHLFSESLHDLGVVGAILSYLTCCGLSFLV